MLRHHLVLLNSEQRIARGEKALLAVRQDLRKIPFEPPFVGAIHESPYIWYSCVSPVRFLCVPTKADYAAYGKWYKLPAQ